MSDQPPATDGPSLSRTLAVVFLILGLVGFGGATLCGAAFTVIGMGGGDYANAVLVIAVPSLLLGGALSCLCVRQLRKLRRPSSAQAGDVS